MELPFVSVIIPVYNGQRTLQDCLQVVCDQAYPQERYEVLVVDNRSQDSTQEIVRTFAQVRLLEENTVQNSYAARNLGIKQARGEIMAFTDADCIPALDWLAQIVRPFEDSRVLAVGGMVQDAAPENLVERFLSQQAILKNYSQAPGQFYPPLVTANAAFHKRALVELGGFNDRLYTGADIDLAWRLQIHHPKSVCYAQEAVVYHRHRSTWKSLFRQYRRHGFGEIFLDAIYSQHPGYPRTLRYQLHRLAGQSWAALKNLRSFVFRLVRYPFHRDLPELLQPLLWLVSESGNILGKLQGLWATRMLRLNPALHRWEDPGG